MEQSSADVRQSNDQSLFLMQSLAEQQKQFLEGTSAWFELQAEINQIIADRFLQYLNR